MMPLEPSTFVSYALAVLTGFAFGFVLERAGFADAKRLAAQFYLTDMRVLKVMFSAVVTAALGLALLRGVGLLDWQEVYVNPTFLGAQLAGGALFGMGFVIGGHCPGTAVVSCVTGRLNGVVFLVGVMLGVLTYAGVYPSLADFATQGGERVTLDQWLGVSYGTAAALVAAMAVALFAGAQWVERWSARKAGTQTEVAGSERTIVRGLLAATAVLAAVTLAFGHDGPAKALSSSGARIESVTPFALARVLRDAPPDQVVWVIGQARHRLDGGIALPLDALSDDALEDRATLHRQIVLAFSDGVRMQRVARRLLAQGHEVRILEGGLEAWDRTMDVDPREPAIGAPAARWDEYRENLALRRYFGGERAPRAVETRAPVAPVPSAAPSASSKREGC